MEFEEALKNKTALIKKLEDEVQKYVQAESALRKTDNNNRQLLRSAKTEN